ncbi:MAG: zinc ribbon domain-containing protein [Nocardioides sp.]|uniref:zinc ribbon domain-containing protein n=1 Tax=Nocardioides sp. TaxID=35761 RepID=UPI003F121F40
MKADPSVQRRLLDVQELDSRVSQLRHQRGSLPVLAEIATLEKERLGIVDQLRDARIVVDDLTVEQKQADADVEQVKARRQRDRDRMDQGLITNPKDLERMQGELESLERRIGTLEDTELEIMEKLEEAQQVHDGLDIRVSDIDAKLADLIGTRDEAWQGIDAELTEVLAKRAPAAEGMPADLMTLYDRLRDQKGGLAAAELRARRCGGCQLTLDNAELARIKAVPADSVVRCEECSRILVRTDESGL